MNQPRTWTAVRFATSASLGLGFDQSRDSWAGWVVWARAGWAMLLPQTLTQLPPTYKKNGDLMTEATDA
jgi:hypothetical protein